MYACATASVWRGQPVRVSALCHQVSSQNAVKLPSLAVNIFNPQLTGGWLTFFLKDFLVFYKPEQMTSQNSQF